MKFQRGQNSKQALNIGLSFKISSWLDEMEIGGYTINDDFTIDVDGDVDLRRKLDGNLPSFIKFRRVMGYFVIRHNNLHSLKGVPKFVEGTFSCSDNNLSSLEGSPKSVGINFYCKDNEVQFTVEDVRKVSNVKGDIHPKYGIR